MIWEYNKPYMIYSHDHRDIIGEETQRHRFARSWFQHSFLNVFISPMHRDNFIAHLGEVVEPLHVLTPPVDVDFFYPRKEVERKFKSAVNLTGRLVSSKGMLNVYNWSLVNPKYTVDVYSKYADGTSGKLLSARPNINIYGTAPYKILPWIYSKHHYVIHLPVALEAAGRTLVEGALCGCSLIMNENVGVKSFADKDLPLERRGALRKLLRANVYKFWAVVSYRHRKAVEPTTRRSRLWW